MRRLGRGRSNNVTYRQTFPHRIPSHSILPCRRTGYSPTFGLLKLPELPPLEDDELFFFFAPNSCSIVNLSVFPICPPTQTSRARTTRQRRNVDSVNSIWACSVAIA